MKKESDDVSTFFKVKLLQDADPQARQLVYRLCFTWGCVVSCWAVLNGITPLLLKDIVGSSEAAWYHGMFAATTAVSGAVTSALVGHLSDHIGRSTLLTPWTVAFMLAVCCLLYAECTHSLMVLWLSRIPALAVPATIVFAFAADVVHGPHVLEAQGALGATLGFSLLASSIVCGVIDKTVSRLASLMFGCVLSVCATVAARDIARSFVASQHSTVRGMSLATAAGVICHDGLLRLLVIGFALMRVCNITSYFMLVLYTNVRLDWQLFDVALLLGLTSCMGIFWQLFGVTYLVTTYNDVTPFLFVSFACCPIAMLGYGLSTTTTGMLVAGMIGSVPAIAGSILTSKISVLAAEVGVAGAALGLVGSIQNAVEIFSAVIFGKVLSWTIAHCKPQDLMFGLPYFINAVCYVIVGCILWYAHRTYGWKRIAWIGHFDGRGATV